MLVLVSPRTAGARGYAAALVIALAAAAVLRFTADPGAADAGRTALWEHKLSELAAVTYSSSTLQLDIRPLSADGGEHLIAVENGAGRTLRYPLGDFGREAVAELAVLRPVRDLGPLDGDPAVYGLGGGSARLTVDFGDELMEIFVGREVPAGEERFALLGPRLVALAGDLITPFELGQGALRVRRLHEFPWSSVRGITLSVDGRSGALTRETGGGWTVAEGVSQAAVRLAERSWQLAVLGFEPPPMAERLGTLVNLGYRDAEGNELGWVELMKDLETDTYWVTSERTVFPALADATLARRVEESLFGVF